MPILRKNPPFGGRFRAVRAAGASRGATWHHFGATSVIGVPDPSAVYTSGNTAGPLQEVPEVVLGPPRSLARVRALVVLTLRVPYSQYSPV